MNASTHHRRKLTILTELIYLKDTSIAATQLCCSFSVFLSMINQPKLYMCTRMGHLANHTHKPYIFGLKILSILCMQRHDFAIAVKGTTSERGSVCLSDIPCSKSLRSCSAAGSPNLCRNMKLRVYQQDNICSSSVYGLCVWFAPERGQMPHAPPKLVPKRAIFGYFFANERPLASSIRHRWKRN